MKIITSFLLLVVLAFGFSACENEKVLPVASIPSEITSYVGIHFPNNVLLQVVREREGLGTSYEVLLQGNVLLEFNRQKEITEIESPNELPDSVIPEAIRVYVEANFPNEDIIEWSLENKEQYIELENGIGLLFDLDGNFKRFEA